MKSGQTKIELLWAKQKSFLKKHFTLYILCIHIPPPYHLALILHCYIRMKAFTPPKQAIWFYFYSQEQCGRNSWRGLFTEAGGEVVTWKSVFIKIWQKVTQANRSCIYTEQPPVGYYLEFGWSTTYPSGRSNFLPDLPRNQQNQNTMNFYNPHQPQTDYLMPWKYYEVPFPHVLKSKANIFKIKILHYDISIRNCNKVVSCDNF